MTTDTRLDRVERKLAEVNSRLGRLEADEREPPPLLNWGQDRPPDLEPEAPAVEPRPVYNRPRERRESSAIDFEAVFGGRVLAWVGGLAILFGAVLFLGMAISRGWLDEETRTIVAALASLGLLGAGVWLYESRGRTEAAQGAVASAISGLSGTIFVATQSYGLIAPGIGLTLGALVAALGFGIAVRWSSPIVAAVGSLGAMAAPFLVGEVLAGSSVAFLAGALAATVGILVWQRWDWLALGAFAVSAPQLAAWVFAGGGDRAWPALAVLVGFWLLYAGAALGYELRSRGEETLPVASWILLFGSCGLVVGLGYHLLDVADHHTAAVVWVLGFAVVQVALGGLALRLRVHREVGALLIGLGIALSAFGLAEALDGPALVAAWAAAAAVLAALATRLDATPEPAISSAERLLLAASGFLALAIGHVLVFEAPPSALFEGVESLGSAAAAIGACTAGSFAVWHFAGRVQPRVAEFGGAVAATTLVYLGSVLIVDTIGVDAAGETRQAGQAWLSAFWTVTGLGAVIWGLVRRSASVRLGGLALLGVAAVKVWTYDLAELDELARVVSFLGLGLLLLVGAFAYGRIKPAASPDPER